MLPLSLDCVLWICPVVFSNGCFPIPFVFYVVLCFCLSSSCVLCTQCCQCLLICPLVFSNVFFPSLYFFVLSCVFCLSSSWVLFPQCCQCLSSIRSWLLLRFSLPFICSSLLFYIYKITLTKRYVVCFALFVFVLCLVHPMLQVSLNCPLWICPVVFSNVYLLISLVFFFLSSSWGLHVHCCLCLSIIHLWLVISIIAFFNIS